MKYIKCSRLDANVVNQNFNEISDILYNLEINLPKNKLFYHYTFLNGTEVDPKEIFINVMDILEYLRELK